MKISRNSLHYRWYQFLVSTFDLKRIPDNLCGYFWGFWFTNLKALLLTLGGLIVGLFIGYIALSPLLMFFSNDETTLFFGLVMCLFGILGASGYLVFKTEESLGIGSVSYEYAKAVKGRYCPRIEFTE